MEQAKRRYRAAITLVPTAEGGRRGYIASRYVRAFWIGHMHGSDRAYNDARITLQNKDILEPGESTTALLDPIAPEFWGRVSSGDAIEFYEGSRRVGIGQILEVIDLFEKPDDGDRKSKTSPD